MANDTALNAGSGGDTIHTIDIAGIKTQVTRTAFGTGAAVTDVTAVSIGAGLPVQAIDGAVVTLGAEADAAALTGTHTLMSFIKGLLTLMPQALGGHGALIVEGVASGTAIPVSLASAPSTAVTNAGTFAVQAAQSTASSLNAQVVGDVAHDGVNAGNPLQMGAVAIAYGTNPTAVSTTLDRTQLYANMAGILHVIGGHPNPVTIELAMTAAQTDVAIVTVGAGVKIVVTRCSYFCSHANTVDVAVRVGFGTATTPTTTGVVLTHPNIAAGSGVVEGDGSGTLGVGADNEDLRITCTVPTTGSARVLVTYFTVPS